MPDLDALETGVLGTSKPILDDEDALIAALEDDDSASFVAFREQRIQQLHNEYVHAKTRLSTGHGTYVEVKEEKELMDLVTNSINTVVHFAKDDFARCKIMDSHLETLAKTYFDTRFVKIFVENAPFLVMKMGIKVLPCVLCWIDDKCVDRIVGFEGLGHFGDKFTTMKLAERLVMSGVVQKPRYINLGGRDKDLIPEKNEEVEWDDSD